MPPLRPARPPRPSAAVWLALGTVGLLLPAAVGVVALVLAMAAWIAAGYPVRRRDWWLVAPAGLVAVAALGCAAFGAWRHPIREARFQKLASSAYTGFWQGLDEQARLAAERVAARTSLDERFDPLAAFDALAEATATAGSAPSEGFLLLDANGVAAAWGGGGLLHEPTGDDLGAGRGIRASFGAATFFVVRPFTSPAPGWALVAGRSVTMPALPFRLPGGVGPAWWTITPEQSWRRTMVEVRAASGADAPALWIDRTGAAPPAWIERVRRAAGWPWGLALVALATPRALGWRTLSPTVLKRRGRPWEAALLFAAAVVAFAAASGARASIVALSGIGSLAAASAALGVLRSRGSWAGRAWAGALAVLVVWLFLLLAPAAWLRLIGSPLAGPEFVWLAFGFAAVVFALLSFLAASFPAAPRISSAWGVAAVLAAVTAAALIEAAPAWWLLAGVAVLGAARLRGSGPSPAAPSVGSTAGLALLAALLAAVSWQGADRWRLRGQLDELAARLQPIDGVALSRWASEVERNLASIDLQGLGPASPERLDGEDLAFTLWSRSPLARRNVRSALVVSLSDGRRSAFSLGLPLAGDALDRSPAVWRDFGLAGPLEPIAEGAVGLRAGDGEQGVARFWVLPERGLSLAPVGPEDARLRILLRAGLAGQSTTEGLPPGVRYAVYDLEGRALRSPWSSPPRLNPPPPSEEPTRALIDTPEGRAAVVARRAGDEIDAFFLPRLSAAAALDRCGTQALAALAGGAAIVALAILSALPLPTFRDGLRRALRSYSKRLLLLVTLLAVLPILVINLVLMQAFGARLQREQRAEGDEALRAAQRVLGEYVDTLAPGFGLDTVLDDDLLRWLARVVQRDINLYWGSRLYAASQPELFSTALLPRRIPGEVYSRLALQGEPLASRTNRAAGETYLELYAPFRRTDTPVRPGAQSQEALTLSVPLVAQQEDLERETAALRRRALLGTAALFVLFVAVAGRAARDFTRPLQELVAGTQRIAAGATSLGVTPSETELQALVEAVDRMAAQIARSREQLRRAERLEAWAEMARMIAHEIKNPLTPIRLSAEHMREVYERNPERFAPVLARCVDNILLQVEELRAIAAEFSTYSQIPKIAPEQVALGAILGEAVAAYDSGGGDSGGGRRVRLDPIAADLEVRLDPRLFARALRNILENAVRVSAGRPVEVVVRRTHNEVRIDVLDRGPGVSEEVLERIFEPYFSTHEAGTGLGLPIARRIVEEHGGRLWAEAREGGGLRVSITLPIAPSEDGGAV